MSEPKLISPLLDGFAMGAPISSHHGVRCCPAMKQNSDSKYIIKIISVPTSQVQLDALLLTGVYKDPGEAMDYFMAQAEDIKKETEFLQTVSRLEGFLPYEGCQIVPMDDNQLGYHIYLLGSYKRSLDRHMRRSTMSPKDAIKLGLDMCCALAACRRAGHIYIALKPTNIYLSEDNEFRIGDLGFVSLESLKFSSLPEKFKSKYCPPEVNDPLQTLNETVDTYSLGLILLQICLGGKLPEIQDDLSFTVPESLPENLSAVIRKALAPKVEDRWSNPAEMGKALAACIEDNTIAAAAPVDPSSTQVFSTEEVIAQAELREPTESDTRVIPPVPAGAHAQAALHSVSTETKVIPTIPNQQAVSSDTKVVPTTQIRDAISSETKVIPAVPQPKPADAIAANQNTNTRVMSKIAVGASVSGSIPSVSRSENSLSEKEEIPEYDDFDDHGEDLEDEEIIPVPSQDRRTRRSIGKGWIVPFVIILVVALLAFGGFYYYQTYYLQTIDSMTIEGRYDSFTVNVVTQIDESLLTINCTDTYGNSTQAPLLNGKAEFNGLLPNSQYKVVLEIEGFHKLVGKTSDVFNTESKTEIVSFTGITGTEDGSVMFTFTVEGPEPAEWIISYSAEGEQTLSKTFTGHSVTVEDLVVPKVYTFTLTPSEDIYVDGQTTLTYTATELVMAQNLAITSFDGSDMTVRWDTPAGEEVSGWSVRCYSDDGFDETLETSDNKAVFSNMDPSRAYYVEVTANGMTQAARTTITANPITITALHVDSDDPGKLTVTWEHKGAAPDGGWLLMYSLDGSATQNIVKCAGTSAEISPRYPGSEYSFTIQAADSTSIFSNVHSYSCPHAEDYDDHSFDVDKTVAYLVVTPEKENWTSANVSKDDYTDTFTVGQKISVVLYCSNRFFIPNDDISILYVIRNSEGQVVTSLTSQAMDDWHDMWVHYNTNYAELDIPTVPTEPGSYSLFIYFNGKYVATANFSITE